MALSPNISRVEGVLDRIEVKDLAVQVHAGRVVVESVFKAVQSHAIAKQQWLLHAPSQNHASLQGCQIIESVSNEIGIPTLAASNGTTEDAIRRVLAGLLEHVRKIYQNAHNTSMTSNASIQPQLAPIIKRALPSSLFGDIAWPASMPAHARMLKNAYMEIFYKSESYENGCTVIPLKDLHTIKEGIVQLDTKLTHMYTNNLKLILPEHRSAYQPEPWYQNTLRSQDYLNDLRMRKKAGVIQHNRTSLPQPANQEGRTIGEAPYLKVANYVAQPTIPGALQSTAGAAHPDSMSGGNLGYRPIPPSPQADGSGSVVDMQGYSLLQHSISLLT
ncbi:hypothetical protein CC78DRAFT_295393 [Lojkania enalia]|uniref:Uncharacterized protein n=1 Tax=Lojkania enalia TaxID=147567 RepID=A0A9P4K6Y6_9PLEO|nr:hypothetical protein CC78DRAFT_295393 [Didymosphaeria enalia]